MRDDLEGRRVLVTGASSGIGAEVCRSVVGAGGSVAMLARRRERLDELHDELGERAVAVPCDVTDLEALERSVGRAADALEGLDGLVAVAGRSMAGTIPTGTPAQWRELFELNLLGPLATVRFAVDRFVASGRRDVVLIGSVGARTPVPGVGIYGASKRGLQAAFDSLRYELAVLGINATMIVPGMFETEGLTIETMVLDGDIPDYDIPYFVPDAQPGDPAVLGRIIAFTMGLPEGVGINELVVRPTGQLNP